MDAVVWTMQAIPFLPEKTITDTLDRYRATEIQKEPSLLLRYYNIKTGSHAVLSAVNSLTRAVEMMAQPEPLASQGIRNVYWVIKVVEMLVSNTE